MWNPFSNPFAKPDAALYAQNVVPLNEASHDSHSIDEKTASINSNEKATAGRSSPTRGTLSIEILKAEVENDAAVDGHNTAYDRKSKVLNIAIQDMGMGRYQWELFVLCGFGWMADNLWLQGIALTLTPISMEFGIDEDTVRYTTLSLFVGLCIGASFWGTGSDIVGRRLAFNTTLFLAGAFGLASGGGPNWIGTCALYACIGLGVGGNLPVDGALFLEFLPYTSNNLLTLLSVWWPVGQLISSLLAWAYIPNFSCATAVGCTKEQNFGWRYLILTLGALTFTMWIVRSLIFYLYESPKFLLSQGRQADAVTVIQGIAHRNKTQTWLTEDILNQVGGDPEVTGEDSKLSVTDIVKRSLSKFSTQRIGPLFSNGWRLSVTTVLIWFIWAAIGMGYPLFNAFLPQYLAGNGGTAPTPTNIVYRNYAITSIVGVPGSLIGCYTVNIKWIGRKGTMAIATVISGIFLFMFTLKNDPNYQLVFSSLEAFFQNIMYGVLYAYTPEVFPARNRGTGSGIASFFNRIAGLCAPIVALHAGQANPAAPIYAAGGLFIAAFVAMVLLPIETRGKQTL